MNRALSPLMRPPSSCTRRSNAPPLSYRASRYAKVSTTPNLRSMPAGRVHTSRRTCSTTCVRFRPRQTGSSSPSSSGCGIAKASAPVHAPSRRSAQRPRSGAPSTTGATIGAMTRSVSVSRHTGSSHTAGNTAAGTGSDRTIQDSTRSRTTRACSPSRSQRAASRTAAGSFLTPAGTLAGTRPAAVRQASTGRRVPSTVSAWPVAIAIHPMARHS
ncbi:hypothetical protein HD596_008198 [Nonomuraea jabiensis]|uniref:Uncharacterized protein n=1 Tax=Nonomuraea jabiensis TaxID=882448 RepID=A0A7W9GCV3_9ACTN|nr:hypothetical protein [Nonomuraea jabiensis]MBB5781442.1 hypothetical protein [Nonomuraea jabiensis]